MSKVKGMQNLRRKLMAVPKEVEKEAIKVLHTNADEFVDAAKSAAPDGYTGQLAQGIVKGDLETVKRGKAIDGAKRDNLRIQVKSTTFYAKSVEYGHGVKNQKGGKTIGHARANPNFFRAWDSMKKRLRSRTNREMRKSIKRAWFTK